MFPHHDIGLVLWRGQGGREYFFVDHCFHFAVSHGFGRHAAF